MVDSDFLFGYRLYIKSLLNESMCLINGIAYK
jgi:hypothetical protein